MYMYLWFAEYELKHSFADTVRVVAALIQEIGILNKQDVEQFPSLFMALQEQGDKPDDVELKEKTDILLAPFKAAAREQRERMGKDFIIE